MISEERHLGIRCDECHWPAPADDELGGPMLFDLGVSDSVLNNAQRLLVEGDDWTENGEGKIHCPTCTPLELTEEAKAERARERERTGLTLFDLEGTLS